MESIQTQTLNILIGLCGSTAALDSISLIHKIMQKEKEFNQKIVLTESSKLYIQENDFKQQLQSLDIQFYDDKSEHSWKKLGDRVEHIELRKWAHIFIIYPLCTHSLAQISLGLCDNLLTCIARAWDFSLNNKQQETTIEGKKIKLLNYPFIVAPSMNEIAFNHPSTINNINQLREWGIVVLYKEPILASKIESQNIQAEKKKSEEDIIIDHEKLVDYLFILIRLLKL